MIKCTLRFPAAPELILAAFTFVCSHAFAVNPTPRGGGPGVGSPTPTLAASPSPTAVPPGTVDEKLFKGMQWRQIGPFRGGRALAIEGVPGEPDTYYFGAVAGGVWKTIDGGANWIPLFDKQPISSIGAVAVAPSDHNVIYAGTGETAFRAESWARLASPFPERILTASMQSSRPRKAVSTARTMRGSIGPA